MGKVIELWLLLAVLNFARTEDNVIQTYFLEGGKVTLVPSSTVTDRINSVLWKFKGDLLADWVEKLDSLDFYGNFKGRTTLDTNTGRLEIDKMTKSDEGLYSVEINSQVQLERYKATAIKKVPQPVIITRPLTCTAKSDSCILACTAVTTEAEPVTYSWKTGDGRWNESAKDITITKTEHSQVKTFTCRIKNPVSEEDSEPKDNPLYENPPTASKTVFGVLIPLLLILLLGAGALVAWKQKKGPFKDRGNGATVSAPHKPDQPASNDSETVRLKEKSSDSRDDGGDAA